MNMYFSVDDLSSDFSEKLAAAFQASASINHHLNFYVLIDLAFDEPARCSLQRSWTGAAFSLYAGTAHEGLLDMSPHLIPLGMTPMETLPHWHSLIRMSVGKPMVSFIASTLPAQELLKVFRPFLEVNVDNEQSFLLRFADTRILPKLDSILIAEKAPGWRKNVAHWWFADRSGMLAALPDYSDDSQHAETHGRPVFLSQLTFDQLVDASETDAILNAISDQNYGLLKGRMPSQVYAMVENLKPVLAEFSIENFADVVMFFTVVLSTSTEFYKHPDFQQVLQARVWMPGKLGSALAEIPEASWAEIERK